MNDKNKRALFDAITGIDEAMIEEAAAPRVRPLPRRLLRLGAIAAVVAILLTALLWPRDAQTGPQLDVPTTGSAATTAPKQPDATIIMPTEGPNQQLVMLSNVVKMYSYEQGSGNEEELKQYEVMDTLDHYGSFWIETVYSQYGIRFSFSLPGDLYGDAEITIVLSSVYGEFYVKNNETGKRERVGKNAEIGPGERITWRAECDLQQIKQDVDPGEIYLHIIIYADDNIVGFGVVEMAGNYILDRSYYAVTLRRFRTFCYPMVDGVYQTVTEEYIIAQIAECEKTMQEDFDAWLAEKEKEREQEKKEGKS